MRKTIYAACITAAACTAAHAQSRPVSQAPDTIEELFTYLGQCVRLPAGSEGSEITFKFSLTHYGALRGKPMITYSKLTGDIEAKKLFVAAALNSLEKCTPVPVTEHFGQVAGQKLIFWRLIAPGRRA